MALILRLLPLVMLCAPAFTLADDPDEAVKVFNELKFPVVSISNSEGFGTGVLIDPSGLILTCAHVVTSPIPYEVKVDLGTVDEAKVVTFKKVQIVGYHPERDLALIRIDPKENNATLQSAVISKDKASTGQRIYAIGNPGAGDKMLEKTITQGIVSGVDREFSQQKFYQIDAAVNPGNSGGPVVDHNGKVVGIVTFQFTNLQALNFAIPLRDIDMTKFGPLTEHKADPTRSAELLKQAKQFTEAARQMLQQQGADSDEYRKALAYANQCYAEALIYDPSNPEIYTDIGTQDVGLGMYDSAAAYLVRAVEIRPWGINNSLTYHELGLSYDRQNMGDKALITWKEGQAKFPYTAALWDDISVYQLDKEQYSDAAYSASVALACGGRKARIVGLQRIVRTAREHLDESEKAELLKKTDHDAICQALEEMRVKSNKARKHRTLYMTEEFVDLMKQVGTLDVPGVEDKIAQVPLKAPEALAIGEDVADADADPDAKPKPKKHIAVAEDDQGDDTVPAPHKKAVIPDDPADPGTPPADAPAPGKPKVAAPPADDQPDVPEPHHNKPEKNAEDNSDESPKNKAKPAEKGGGDDWIGGGSPKKGSKSAEVPAVPPSTVIAPTPAITGLDLAGTVGTIDDAKVVPLDLDKQEVSDAVFSSDGSTLYVLQKSGMLRKIAFPSLHEERQTNLASAVVGMGMTHKGLAVYVSSAQELWLLDSDTLDVKHRTGIPGVIRMSTAPAIGKVLVSTGKGDLQLVDPLAETVSEKLAANGAGAEFAFDLFALSPDGQSVFCNQNGAIAQFSLSDGQLSYVAIGPKIGSEPRKIIVSPDSKYVCMTCKGGNVLPDVDAKSGPVTCVFRASDLQKPVMTIASGASPHEFGFDVPARQLYAQNNQRQLMVFSPSGDKIKEYTLDKDADPDSVKFLVHPSGRSLVVLAGGSVQWVTLP
jgi:V8-like Glu-specific endopeptidase/tetratricopeptide (TPR) repeat protein